MVESQTEITKNTKNIRIIFGIIFILVLATDAFYILNNHHTSQAQFELMKTAQSQITTVDLLVEEVNLAINDTNYTGSDIEDLRIKFEEGSKLLLSFCLEMGFKENSAIMKFHSLNKNNQDELISVINVVSSKRNEAYQNRSLFASRLSKISHYYKDGVNKVEELSLVKANQTHELTFLVLMISGVVFILLGLAIHFILFNPIATVNKRLNEKIELENTELKSKEIKVQKANKIEHQNNALLKVKSAQVLKLQESLELAIAYSNKTQQDKNFIYYNIATDLSEYIKVINLQQKIIENQTSLGKNENWVILSNTISQLNSLTGNYFNQAKNGLKNTQNSEVYLTQLMSEIIVSLNKKGKVKFEQVADMPTIKTDIELLKRILKPYFKLMSQQKQEHTISFSAREDDTYCEFKFLGLQKEFEEELEILQKKELADFSFEEFKVHMANKVIVERGGKYWVQFDAKGKGVFTIYWPV